jgi:hypothetical protein
VRGLGWRGMQCVGTRSTRRLQDKIAMFAPMVKIISTLMIGKAPFLKAAKIKPRLRLRRARGWTAAWLRLRWDPFFPGRPRAKVGGHLDGRFCRRTLSPSAGRPDRDAGGFQIPCRSFAPDVGSPP